MDLETYSISRDACESDTSDEDLDSLDLEIARHSRQVDNSEMQNVLKRWERKNSSLPALVMFSSDSLGMGLRFMLLDTDFCVASTAKLHQSVKSSLPDCLQQMREQSCNRLYGVTESGQSILVNSFGFVPYFYALPSHPFAPDLMPCLETELNNHIVHHIQQQFSAGTLYHDIVRNSPPIVHMELLDIAECDIYDLHVPKLCSTTSLNKQARASCDTSIEQNLDLTGILRKKSGHWGSKIPRRAKQEHETKILKIHCRFSKFVWTAMKIFKKNLITFPFLNGKPCIYQTFEAAINHNVRFLVDLNLAGCSWIEVESGMYHRRDVDLKESHCQIEVDCNFRNIMSISNDPILASRIPPIRIVSFDIECMVRPPHFSFPRDGSDRVLQIGVTLTTFGSKRLEKIIFMLGTCAEIADTSVFCFEDEVEMLESWRLFIVTADPDILLGYNIKKFDFPFLFERARRIKAVNFPFLGRVKGSVASTRLIQNPVKRTTQYDERSIKITGRVIFDMMVLVMRHDTRPGGNFSLANVSKRYLASGETKELVNYKEIFMLQNVGPLSRKRLAQYCVQDSKLPYMLLLAHNPNPNSEIKQNTLEYYIDRARTSGTPLRYLVTKSIQYSKYYGLISRQKNPNSRSLGVMSCNSPSEFNNLPPVSNSVVQTISNLNSGYLGGNQKFYGSATVGSTSYLLSPEAIQDNQSSLCLHEGFKLNQSVSLPAHENRVSFSGINIQSSVRRTESAGQSKPPYCLETYNAAPQMCVKSLCSINHSCSSTFGWVDASMKPMSMECLGFPRNCRRFDTADNYNQELFAAFQALRKAVNCYSDSTEAGLILYSACKEYCLAWKDRTF